MMNLGTIDEILDKLQTVLIQDNFKSENLTTIVIDWNEDFVIIECNSELSTAIIEKDFFESKSDFLKELINSIKKFSLLNIHAPIKVCDAQLSTDCLYETKSCDTFYSKVSEYTGLKKIAIFELLLPLYEAEIYFFVKPENLDPSLSRLLITSGSFHSATVNTLYVEMTNASEHLENVSFLGKINSTDHHILKKIIDTVVRNLLEHINKQKYTENNIDCMQIGIIDLTTGLIKEDHKYLKIPDDEVFYETNTSEIMEIDFPLSEFYDPEIKGLTEGWDARVDPKLYKNATYDEEIMSKFLECSLHKNNRKQMPIWDKDLEPDEPVVTKKVEHSKSDDDLQIVSVESTSNTFGRYSGKWKLRQRNNGKAQHPSSTRMSLGGNRTSNRIKSNLFNDEEVVKWEKSKGSDDMSKLLLSTNKEYKNLTHCLDRDYKIPKKSYNGPSARPSIHNSTKDSKMYKPDAKPGMMNIFQKHVESLVPYDSPSGYRPTERTTPESVSNFINVETIHVIDDDDENDDNNNHINNDKVLQKGPAKRRLLPISPKMFKHRRTDYNLHDSPFTSNVSRKSSGRRNL